MDRGVESGGEIRRRSGWKAKESKVKEMERRKGERG